MRQLLRLSPIPDAVFCYNDPVAIGAMKAILETGLKMLQDISVVGAGNVHYSDVWRCHSLLSIKDLAAWASSPPNYSLNESQRTMRPKKIGLYLGSWNGNRRDGRFRTCQQRTLKD